MLKELKENMNKELKEIRKMIYKQNENTSKIVIIMKKKTLELKILLEEFKSRTEQAEESINLKKVNLELLSLGNKKEK